MRQEKLGSVTFKIPSIEVRVFNYTIFKVSSAVARKQENHFLAKLHEY